MSLSFRKQTRQYSDLRDSALTLITSTMPPISLGDLPIEILHQILNDDVLHHADVHAICLTSMQVYELANPFLYENISIRLYNAANDRGSIWKKSYSLVLTLSKYNPALGASVRNLSITWPSYIFGDMKEYVVPLLKCLSRLRKLRLEALDTGNGYGSHPKTYFLAKYIKLNPLCELAELQLINITISFQSAAYLMLLPNIKSMSFSNLSTWSTHSDPIRPLPPNARSPLRQLVLGPNSKPVSGLLDETFEFLHDLKKLAWDLGVLYTLDNPGILPTTLNEVLSPLAKTLEELHLSGHHTHSLHRSTVDFSSFALLRELSISQSLLFPTEFQQVGIESTEPFTRNSLYRRLPRRLEYLNVYASLPQFSHIPLFTILPDFLWYRIYNLRSPIPYKTSLFYRGRLRLDRGARCPKG